MVNHYTIVFGIFDGVKHEEGKSIPIIDEFESDNQECNREIGPVWKKMIIHRS